MATSNISVTDGRNFPTSTLLTWKQLFEYYTSSYQNTKTVNYNEMLQNNIYDQIDHDNTHTVQTVGRYTGQEWGSHVSTCNASDKQGVAHEVRSSLSTIVPFLHQHYAFHRQL